MAQDTYSDNDYFKMGAAVAVGELYDSGRLGEKSEVASEVREYLESFGLRSLEDMRRLGISGQFLDDFKAAYQS